MFLLLLMLMDSTLAHPIAQFFMFSTIMSRIAFGIGIGDKVL